MADKSIREQSAVVAEMAANWPLIEALMGGTPAIRAAGKAYLPQWPQESDASYECRRKTAVLHPVFKRTVLVNASRPFSRAIKFDEKTPSQVQEWTADVDRQGSTLVAFGTQLMVHCLSFGLTGVLVDHPKAQGVRTLAEESAAGLRPYLTEYRGPHILGWRATSGADGRTLTQLRLLEHVEVDDGAFGTKKVDQVRLLEPGRWVTYRADGKDPNTWNETEQGTTSLTDIPFVFFYGFRRGFGIGAPPLLDLAHQNVEHWQSASDQQTILHVARVPILFAKLFGDDAEITIGANTAAQAEDKDADLKYVEHTGAAIGAGRQSLLDLEDRMRSTGAELISQIPSHITATQVRGEGEAQKSTLQQITEVFEESLSECLNLMARWKKLQESASVELYKNFETFTSTDPQALAAAQKGGAISSRTFFEELQRRDVLSSDRTWQEEEGRLRAESDADEPPEDDPPGAELN